ncbi:hypothetical protein [Cytobacillus oceanisediminis]|uniref:Uncharacterized protein n=1 Tax=Cytobacillus oceanisediminis 2691 TaxID=1196031 RepID=A0A160MB66_9BACI|nr:hypothetical protein [Cytobacillus oceanisediminis]AND39528.1 hypothetical protein A361_10415 [Cytobacillus oceanisediminis 2691]
MNSVLEFPCLKPQETDTEVLQLFAAECIQENKESVIQMINALKQPDVTYIIETITFKIMSLVLAEKSKGSIVEYISSGTYYKLTQLLIEGFQSDPDIISSIPKRV